MVIVIVDAMCFCVVIMLVVVSVFHCLWHFGISGWRHAASFPSFCVI